MSRSSVHEYASAIRLRYQKADRAKRKKILDEFVITTGYHRKSAVRLLGTIPKAGDKRNGGQRRGRPCLYEPSVVSALRVVWESADWICSQRLRPFMPQLIEALQRHGELVIDPGVEMQLKAMSSSTMDRMMRPHRRSQVRRGLSTTKPGTLLKESIPVRTFADWNEQKVGFLEIDLVAHCGESTRDFYLNTLNATDVMTGWTESMGVWGKGQARVGGAIDAIKRRLPFPMLGLDSDNGGEFINHGLYKYCEQHKITFTRSRPYKKNDQSYVEQKNWTTVRRIVGYDRYSSKAALAQLNELYGVLRLYVNFFQPVLKLVSKERQGAKVSKHYDVARTPYERLCRLDVIDDGQKKTMDKLYESLNPMKLRKEIDEALEKLWKLNERKNAEKESA
ncbi:MAG: transposase family protein [Dehalococcoidia bacterium]|nr:transposase family protein [Dehalococcoidia bacterium]